MLRPAYKITLGKGAPQAVVALGVARAQNAGPGLVTLQLGSADGASQGDPATVELGWDGSTSLVFTGTVSAVERRLDGLRVDCTGSHSALTLARGGTTYVQQTAGGVVSALASDA